MEIKTTCPRDCYDACGMIVRVEDGTITKVKGDPDHERSRGTLCAKCAVAYNSVWIDPTARVLEPLRRIGSKGSGRFEPISWDAALELMAERLAEPILAGRPDQILHTHYTGTCSLLAGAMPSRLFDVLGATEVDPDTVCNNAGHAMLGLMFGDSLSGFDPRSAKESQCLVVWGANPSAAAPHVHKHWIPEFPGTTVVIDPVRHPTGRIADIYIQPRPGTDNAVAFGLLAAVRDLGRIDTSFLAERCNGWDEIAATLDGCLVEDMASRADVPASSLREVAELISSSRTLMWLGQGLQRQRRGGEVFRSCVTVAAATGNIVGPGRGVLYMNGPDGRGLDLSVIEGPASPAPKVSHMDLVEVLTDPDRSRALFCWNNNIAASNPRQRDLRAALQREDLFTVVWEIFPTDTADYADLVLPAATFLEFDDIVASYFDRTVSAQVAATAPSGCALPNQEIARRIAATLDLDDPVLAQTDEDLLEALLGPLEIDFATLAAAGTVAIGDPAVHPFRDAFPTASGRLELAGALFADAGLERAPAPDVDDPPPPGILRLLSPADTWTMNSSYSNAPQVQRRLGPLTVTVNPEEMTSRGLDEGAPIVVRSSAGELRARISSSVDVRVGVALCPKGRWPKSDASSGNVNMVTEAIRTDIGDSSAIHSVFVAIEPDAEQVTPGAHPAHDLIGEEA